MLEVKDLRVHYGMVEVIKGISFDAVHGEVISLIGWWLPGTDVI